MEQSVTQITADSSLFDHFPPPSASPNHPYTQEGDRTRNTNKWTQPPVKEKHKPHTDTPHMHTCIRPLGLHTHSLYEQSSCVQWSWERQHCLVHRHHLHNLCHCPAWKHTYTEVTVFIYLLGDMRLFYVHTCAGNTSTFLGVLDWQHYTYTCTFYIISVIFTT